MGRITVFADGSFLEYDRGQFDDWCVYLTRPNVGRYAPRDFQYFQRLQQFAEQYGSQSLYNDFVAIYNKTSKAMDNSMFEFIVDLCQKYGEDSLTIAIDFSIIYMGMVAEENKAFTKLGKRIKRLGVYQTLMENISYSDAANFSRGRKWRELDAICKERGF